MKKEEIEIMKVKFKAKTQTILETTVSEDLKGCHMRIKAESIIVMQKYQAKKIVFVNIKVNIKKQQYVEHDACKLALRQFINQKLHLIIKLPLSQKNQVMKILLFLTNCKRG